MSFSLSDKRFRVTYEEERKRLEAAILECEETNEMITSLINELRGDMKRVRGAGSMLIRLTEQLTSNRNHRLALIKELKAISKDVVDREFRLTMAEKETEQAEAGTAVTSSLLTHLQGIMLVKGGVASILDPITPNPIPAPTLMATSTEKPPISDEPKKGKRGRKKTKVSETNQEETKEQSEESTEFEIPTDIRPGDTVSDLSGRLWIINDEGFAEPTDSYAADVFVRDENGIAYAILETGEYVAAADIAT